MNTQLYKQTPCQLFSPWAKGTSPLPWHTLCRANPSHLGPAWPCQHRIGTDSGVPKRVGPLWRYPKGAARWHTLLEFPLTTRRHYAKYQSGCGRGHDRHQPPHTVAAGGRWGIDQHRQRCPQPGGAGAGGVAGVDAGPYRASVQCPGLTPLVPSGCGRCAGPGGSGGVALYQPTRGARGGK